MYNPTMSSCKEAGAAASTCNATPPKSRFKGKFRRVLQLVRLLYAFGFLHFSAREKTRQQLEIRITLESTPLDKVLVEMGKLWGHTVPYNMAVFKVTGAITFEINDANIEKILLE
jgi:hypothetical protein